MGCTQDGEEEVGGERNKFIRTTKTHFINNHVPGSARAHGGAGQNMEGAGGHTD